MAKYLDPEYMKKYNRQFGRRTRLKHRYDLSEEEWDKMFAAQGKCCAICKATNALWCVDHDARTDFVRGILCRKCNVGLGHFNHLPERFRVAENYLETARLDAAVAVRL